ncbi:hypothetical protein BKI52_33730 [marine bacterium AO1-C]|nr:hypothetical protein BKI52_33730 [marine bacterium AO1-C]
MEFEDFYKQYAEVENVSTLTDIVLEAFSESLSPAIYEQYDVVSIVLNFLSDHEDSKKYQQIEAFYQVLMEHNQTLFLETKDYFVEALVKYYCFQGNRDKVLSYLQDLLSFGYQNYDIMLLTLYHALFYGYTETVDELIEHLFVKVQNDENLMEGATVDFTLFKFSIELEKLYKEQGQSADKLDWQPFREKMAKYDFDLVEEFRQVVDRGLVYKGDNVREDLLNTFPENKQAILGTLQLVFMKYIHQQGCSFVVSAMTWNSLLEYWVDNKAKNWETFFQFEQERFTDFLRDKGGVVMDYRHMMANILWGSAYVVEFLRAIHVFDEALYQAQTQQIEAVKQNFREAYNVDLWQYSFVLNCTTPTSELAAAQEQEKVLFADAFQLTKEEQGDVLFGNIKDFGLNKPTNLFADSGFDLPPLKPSKPTRRTHSYKRNERVTVRYNDGTVKENVKFKTIQDDFELGECEMV